MPLFSLCWSYSLIHRKHSNILEKETGKEATERDFDALDVNVRYLCLHFSDANFHSRHIVIYGTGCWRKLNTSKIPWYLTYIFDNSKRFLLEVHRPGSTAQNTIHQTSYLYPSSLFCGCCAPYTLLYFFGKRLYGSPEAFTFERIITHWMLFSSSKDEERGAGLIKTIGCDKISMSSICSIFSVVHSLRKFLDIFLSAIFDQSGSNHSAWLLPET